MANITPLDPVTLGLCSQIELDDYVAKAAKREERRQKRLAREAAKSGETLKDADETTALQAEPVAEVTPEANAAEIAASVDDSQVFSDMPGNEPSEAQEETLRPEDVFKI